MRPFDVMVRNTGVVLSDSLKGYITLTVVEDSRACGIVRKNKENKDAPGNGRRTGEEINILPSICQSAGAEIYPASDPLIEPHP
jgi:hypothetical protein